MKIRNSKNYKLSNPLHLQFLSEVVGVVEKFDFILSKTGDLVPVLTNCLEKEERCYKVVRRSRLSDIKEESDNARDAVIVGIKHAIKAGVRHFDEEIQEAAQRLKIVFDTYDKPTPITNLPYDAETVTINNLLQELTGKYVSEMEKTGITAWVAELQAKNEEFDKLVKSYHEESSEKPAFHLTDMRKESDKAYRDVMLYINSLIIVDKENLYDRFVAEINTLIKHYNDLVAQHIGRLDNGEK
jgi:hypothetical protein